MTLSRYLTLQSSEVVTSTSTSSAVSVPPHARSFAIERVVTTITGTSPTLDITVQHSLDGVTWMTLLALTQVVAGSANSAAVQFLSTSTDYLKPIGNYVRTSYTIGGSSTPTFNGVTVRFWYQ